MDKQESVDCLITLLKDLESQSREKAALDSAYSNRQSILNSFRSRLDAFDDANKAPYIEKNVGKEPEKPKGMVKLVIPVYLAKKAKYEKKIGEYRRQYELAEKAYYYDNQAKRSALQDTAEQERKDAIAAADAECQRADQAHRSFLYTSKQVVDEKRYL